MGFRSHFITEDSKIQWPDWFWDKYGKWIQINLRGSLSTNREIKPYSTTFRDLVKDIHIILMDQDYSLDFNMVWLHECGGVTKVVLQGDQVRHGSPKDWEWNSDNDPQCDHWYCYKCSCPEELK